MNTRSVRFRLAAWYAGLLALLLVSFSAATYVGLESYLSRMLGEAMTRRAVEISPLLAEIGRGGETDVVGEIKSHYAPESNNLFIRVTRAGGDVLYASGAPKNGSFDPALVPQLPAFPPGQLSREELLPDGYRLSISAVPFTARDGSRLLVEVGASHRQIGEVLSKLLLVFALTLPLGLAVAVVGGYALTRRALRPVDEITEKAERITSSNLSERLPTPPTGDELERLSVSLNRMIGRLETAFHYVNRFSADASHELRTPLTILRGELETLARTPELTPQVREVIGSSLEEIDRLTKITEGLLVVSRLEAGEAHMEWERFDLAELVRSTTEQISLLAEDKGVALSCDMPEALETHGSPMRLKQVVVNLLDNAIKYTPAGGKVRVALRAWNGRAVLEVADSGPGIPAESIGHIFERFYRADQARARKNGGVGLGLSIAKSICAAHGGEIQVASAEGLGSRFRVELPVTAPRDLSARSPLKAGDGVADVAGKIA